MTDKTREALQELADDHPGEPWDSMREMQKAAQYALKEAP